MLIQFRQGLVKATYSPPFINASGSNVNLVATFNNPVIITFAQGADNYLFQETNNITSAWSGLPMSGNVYLYWDLDLKTAIRTFGYTTLAPYVGPSPPSNPVNGQMWYNTINFSQNVYASGSWNPKLRVLAGTFQNGTLVSIQNLGTQIGNVTPVRAGYVLYDEDNLPIKKFQTFNLGQFIHTESPLASQFSKIQNYRLETTIDSATASGSITQWQAVRYVAADTIGVATCNDVLPPYGSATPAIGIAPQNMTNNTVQNFLQEGYITDPTFNFGPVGANVFIDTSGFLTTTPPNGGTLQVMGYVVDSQTLFISPQPPMLFGSSGPANLVTLQLDQTTGNLVAEPASGTYAPPTGTGFQYVTAGVPNLAAVTNSQATGLLDLFTSSLQGLVPASGGGTANFLRADGTWASPGSGTGTVTSVSLTSPGVIFTVTGSPVTTSGTLALNLIAQAPNTILAGPASGGSANPTFRTLVAADIPVIDLNGGVTGILQAAQFPALSGDVSTPGSSLVATLATVNANVGTFNNVTVNAKGLVTAASNIAYLTGNQTITLSGDVTGSGTTAITATLPNIVSAGTYGLVTVNAKGQVVAGTSPTTLAGYGITDAVSSQVNTTMASAVSLTFVGGGTVTGLPTPAGDTDAANKAYVDAVAQGLSWKQPVRVATLVNGTLATAFANGSTVDGVVLVTGNRILLKNQTTQTDNGIYTVNASGAPTRATDADTGAEIVNAAVFVQEGSQADTAWVQTANAPITIGATNITFVQFGSGSGSGTVTSVAVSGSNGIGVGGSPITTSGTITLSLGAITPTSVAASGALSGSNFSGSSSGTNTGDQTITLTGDVTGTGTGSFATTLANTAVTPGSYTHASLTVDSKGRLTAASNGTAPVTAVTGTATRISSSGGVTPAIDLVTTAVTPGSYTSTNLTVDAYGRITAAASGSGGSGTVTSVTVAGTAGNITSSGSPITSSGSITLNLATTAVTPGSYTHPNITVDSFGRLTAASNGTIPTRTERVVWQYTDVSGTNINPTVVSTTAGIASAIASGTTTTYTFTGYTTPPIAATVFAQAISSPSAFTWNIGPAFSSAIGATMTDTGTPGSPGILTTFSSTPIVSLPDCSGGTVNASSNQPGVFPYLVVIFKF